MFSICNNNRLVKGLHKEKMYDYIFTAYSNNFLRCLTLHLLLQTAL